MRIKILILGLIILFSACMTTKVVKLSSGQNRPPIPFEQVAIYRTADQVPGKYEEIALLSSLRYSAGASEKQAIESMKKKAGNLGANAIILEALSRPLEGAPGINSAKAIAIYVFPKEEKKERQK